MNKIYQVKFNRKSGQYAVMSELQRTSSSAGQVMKIASGLMLATSLVASGLHAQPLPDNVKLNQSAPVTYDGGTTGNVSIQDTDVTFTGPLKVTGTMIFDGEMTVTFEKDTHVHGEALLSNVYTLQNLKVVAKETLSLDHVRNTELESIAAKRLVFSGLDDIVKQWLQAHHMELGHVHVNKIGYLEGSDAAQARSTIVIKDGISGEKDAVLGFDNANLTVSGLVTQVELETPAHVHRSLHSTLYLGTPEKEVIIGEGALISGIQGWGLRSYKENLVHFVNAKVNDGAEIKLAGEISIDGPVHVSGKDTLVVLSHQPSEESADTDASLGTKVMEGALTIDSGAHLALIVSDQVQALELKGDVTVDNGHLHLGIDPKNMEEDDSRRFYIPLSLDDNVMANTTESENPVIVNKIKVVNHGELGTHGGRAIEFNKGLTLDQSSLVGTAKSVTVKGEFVASPGSTVNLDMEKRPFVVTEATRIAGTNWHSQASFTTESLSVSQGSTWEANATSVKKDLTIGSDDASDKSSVTNHATAYLEVEGKTVIHKGSKLHYDQAAVTLGALDSAGSFQAKTLHLGGDVTVRTGGKVAVTETLDVTKNHINLSTQGELSIPNVTLPKDQTLGTLTVGESGTATLKGDMTIDGVRLTGENASATLTFTGEGRAHLTGETDIKNGHLTLETEGNKPLTLQGNVKSAQDGRITVSNGTIVIKPDAHGNNPVIRAEKDGLIEFKTELDNASITVTEGQLQAGKDGKIELSYTGKNPQVSGVFVAEQGGSLNMELGQAGDGLANFKPYAGSMITNLKGYVRLQGDNTGATAVAIQNVDPNAVIEFPNLEGLSNMTPIVFINRVPDSVVFLLPKLTTTREIPNIYFLDEPKDSFMEGVSPEEYRLSAVPVWLTLPDGTKKLYYHMVILPPIDGLLSGYLEGMYSALTKPWSVLPRLDSDAGLWVSVAHDQDARPGQSRSDMKRLEGQVGVDRAMAIGQVPLRLGAFLKVAKLKNTYEGNVKGQGTLFAMTMYGAMPLSDHFQLGMHASYKTLQSEMESKVLSTRHRFKAMSVSVEAAFPWKLAGITWVPQIQVTLTHIPGTTLDAHRAQAPVGKPLPVGGVTSIVSRTGLHMTMPAKIAGLDWRFWAQGDFFYEWKGDQRIEKPEMVVKNQGGWFSTHLGASLYTGPMTLDLEAMRRFGVHRHGFGVQFNVNYAF